jgi:LysR family nitrogen assimilation transcriptional regulator
MALSVPLAETVRVDRPRIQLCAIEAMSGHIKQWVMSGEIDIGLLYDLQELTAFTSQLLLHEDLYFYSGADSWPFSTPPGVPVTLAAVAEVDLILPSLRHGLRMLMDQVMKANGIEGRIVIEMDSLQQIKVLVARGSGYTVLSPAAVHDLTANGTLVGSPIVEPAVRRPVYLVRATQRSVTAASRVVEATCLGVIRDLIKRGIWKADLA